MFLFFYQNNHGLADEKKGIDVNSFDIFTRSRKEEAMNTFQ